MVQIEINEKTTKGHIRPELHSHFIEMLGACIYDGVWVGEESEIPNEKGIRKDFIEAMREIEPPVIRWPGGCYADTYHWRDGIGPKNTRPTRFNENFATYELDTNQFGIHEFMDLCKMVGAKPWLNVNMLSGSVQEMKDWMEYCNRESETSLAKEREKNGSKEPFGVELWGIGNEAWCGGGNYTAAGYAAEYRKYATAAPTFKTNLMEPSKYPMKMIAVGPDGNKPMERKKWTSDFFDALSEYRNPPLWGMDLHFYNWNIEHLEDSDLFFEKEGWDRVIENCFELEEVICEQYELIQEGLKKIPKPEVAAMGTESGCELCVGEWGNWHGNAFLARPALFQQVTMRDAVTSALTLDIFHRNCQKVSMACVAQTVNVLNSLFLTEKEKFIKTPNFDVFKMYKVHRDGELLDISYEESKEKEAVHVLASIKDEIISINLVNTSYDENKNVSIHLPEEFTYLAGQSLYSEKPQDYNSFENPDKIRAKECEKPILKAGSFEFHLKPASVNVVQFARK